MHPVKIERAGCDPAANICQHTPIPAKVLDQIDVVFTSFYINQSWFQKVAPSTLLCFSNRKKLMFSFQLQTIYVSRRVSVDAIFCKIKNQEYSSNVLSILYTAKPLLTSMDINPYMLILESLVREVKYSTNESWKISSKENLHTSFIWYKHT